MMEKIQEQTEIVEVNIFKLNYYNLIILCSFVIQKQTIILKRSHGSKESSKYFRSKINNLKTEIADKQRELDYVLNVYTGLEKT